VVNDPRIKAPAAKSGFGSALAHAAIVRRFGGTPDCDRHAGLAVTNPLPIQRRKAAITIPGSAHDRQRRAALDAGGLGLSHEKPARPQKNSFKSMVYGYTYLDNTCYQE
jgi:hypothetical protein